MNNGDLIVANFFIPYHATFKSLDLFHFITIIKYVTLKTKKNSFHRHHNILKVTRFLTVLLINKSKSLVYIKQINVESTQSAFISLFTSSLNRMIRLVTMHTSKKQSC